MASQVDRRLLVDAISPSWGMGLEIVDGAL